MQANVILKEPPPWVTPPPQPLRGARVMGGCGAWPPPRTPLPVGQLFSLQKKKRCGHTLRKMITIRQPKIHAIQSS